MLDKVMGAVFQSLNDPKKIRIIESWLMKSKSLGIDIGHIAFKLLMTIYMGAKQSGVMIPITVFYGQGGAIYQTIDRLLMLAEHAGVPGINADQVREDALGVVNDSVKAQFGADAGGGQQQGAQPQQAPPPQAGQPMAANPMSAAVGQGLQQQGLLGGGQ